LLLRWSPLFLSFEVLDGFGEAVALLVDPALAGICRGECLGELDRVVADDVLDRRPVDRGPLPQIGGVVQHRDHHGGVAVEVAREHSADGVDPPAIPGLARIPALQRRVDVRPVGAKVQHADIVVFSELCVCGYPPRDFVEFNDFINKCYAGIDIIKEHADTIAVIVGSPARNPIKEGKDLFNAAFFLYGKEIKAEIHKTCLPTYDVFDEYRYFEPAYDWRTIEFKGKRIALTICEDIWNLGNNPIYRICPMDMLMEQNPDFMINISASPFDYTHDEDRKAIVKANVLKYKLPMFYCNGVGSQTEIVFDGASLEFDKNANLCKKLPMFKEAIETATLNDDGTIDAPIIEVANRIPDHELNPPTLDEFLNIQQVHDALVMGIKDYFEKMGFKKPFLVLQVA